MENTCAALQKSWVRLPIDMVEVNGEEEWIFWDEAYFDCYGPFPSLASARFALAHYVYWLL